MSRHSSIMRSTAGRSFQAIIVGCRCQQRLQSFSRQRPGALIIASEAYILARNGTVIAMPAKEKALFLTVVGRLGGWAPYGSIEDALWGHDPNGGPDDTRRIISVLVHRLRQAALLLGFRLECHGAFGICAVDLFPTEQEQAVA